MAAPRPWTKLYNSALTSDRVLDLSPPAAKLWFMSLMRAAQECRDGLVVAAPARRVGRWSGLDAELVEPAIAELAAVGLWELDGDDARLWKWDLQPAEEKVASGRRAAAERVARHRKAKAAAKPEKPAGEPGDDLASVLERLWAACDDYVDDACDQETAVARYRQLYASARDKGGKGGQYADVKGVGPARLGNLVAEHAAVRWCGLDRTRTGDLRRVAAMCRDHGDRVFGALAVAGSRASRDPLAFALAVLEGRGK